MTNPESKPPKQKQPKRDWRNLMLYFIIALIVVGVVLNISNDQNDKQQTSFSDFMDALNRGEITEVVVHSHNQLIVGKTNSNKQIRTYFIDYPSFVKDLQEKNVKIVVNPSDSGWFFSLFLQALLPFLLIAGLWFFIFRQAQGANNQALSFGKSRATPWQKGQKPDVTFKDVAGVDEAKEELEEIVSFLKHPKKYQDIGAKIPRGALLLGPPGTGKTLLAKAIAGEANVPFFSLSGSDFVEMFVGVGASRVRDLFRQAKKSAPCIIFLDEIDAVGRQRGAGLGGGHDEREQTLNQLLVEMDGFDAKTTVIVIAATNRADILDPALLRPGRFDRQIVVDRPDVNGRFDILKIHAKGKKLSKNINLNIVARRTPGFTGADLANLLNEAALLSARKGLKTISMKQIEEATDRVMAGPERKSKVMTDHEREIVAYHEVGHAIVAKKLPYSDPVHKISILPRGHALGYTLQLPETDKYLSSREEIQTRISVLMGGRIAEEIIFDSITSGASNDIEKATALARQYVCIYGMSPALGTRKYGKADHQVFLGRDYSDHSKDYSETTAHEIDMAIKDLIETQYSTAKTLLLENKDKLISISKELMKKEVLEADEFIELLEGTTTRVKKRKKTDAEMDEPQNPDSETAA